MYKLINKCIEWKVLLKIIILYWKYMIEVKVLAIYVAVSVWVFFLVYCLLSTASSVAWVQRYESFEQCWIEPKLQISLSFLYLSFFCFLSLTFPKLFYSLNPRSNNSLHSFSNIKYEQNYFILNGWCRYNWSHTLGCT